MQNLRKKAIALKYFKLMFNDLKAMKGISLFIFTYIWN